MLYDSVKMHYPNGNAPSISKAKQHFFVIMGWLSKNGCLSEKGKQEYSEKGIHDNFQLSSDLLNEKGQKILNAIYYTWTKSINYDKKPDTKLFDLYVEKNKNNLEEITITENVSDYFEVLNDEDASLILDIFKNHIKKDEYTDTIFNAIKLGISKNKIVFVRCTSNTFKIFLKGMASSILKPFSGFDAVKNLIRNLEEEEHALYIAGAFIPKENIIRIVVDGQRISLLQNNTNKMLSNKIFFTLLHEFCHYMAANYPKKFSNLFSTKYLIPFYTVFFSLMNYYIVNRKSIDKDLLSNFTKTFIAVALSCEDLNFKSTKPISYMYHKLEDIDSLLANAWYYSLEECFTKLSSEFKHYIYGLLYITYKSLNIDDTRSFFYQELLFPSEVICIASSYNYKQPEFIQMLKSLF